MVAAPKAVFTLFDEYIVDYRRLRFRLKLPQFVNDLPVHYTVIHMDEWIDSMVENERVVDLALPYLPPRQMLVQKGEVDPRQYAVSEDEASLSDYESDSD